VSRDTAPRPAEPWSVLRSLTPARVALGRTGASLPTNEIVRFGLAHALARDAVHAALDEALVQRQLASLGEPVLTVASAAADRATFLRRPDLGRRLPPEAEAKLAAVHGHGADVALVIADGLSATAVHHHAAPLLGMLLPALRQQGLSLAPLVLAHQARVALGDAVGAALGVRLVLVLIGERPGLSAPDSLGAYLTYGPQVGRRDHERNCVSNIRAAGLSPERATHSLLWLVTEALRRGETGVALKDESGDRTRVPGSAGAPSLP
jgi:ethanolamine ammonia-lyase small subunit